MTTFCIFLNSNFMLSFFSHVQAGYHFNVDPRTVKKYYNVEYILDKNPLNNPNAKVISCKQCGSSVLSKDARHGNCPACKIKQAPRTDRYCKICNSKSCIENRVNEHDVCKTCTSKGLGRQLQAKAISLKFTGANNPNYSTGTSKTYFYQNSTWRNLKKSLPNACEKCGSTDNVHHHHIIPACILSDTEKVNPDVIIALCSLHHKELHHLQLDIELLPSLYQQYKTDAPQLREYFCRQPEFQSMSLPAEQKYSELCLLQLVPKNYYKKIQSVHPEFFQQELAHLVSK